MWHTRGLGVNYYFSVNLPQYKDDGVKNTIGTAHLINGLALLLFNNNLLLNYFHSYCGDVIKAKHCSSCRFVLHREKEERKREAPLQQLNHLLLYLQGTWSTLNGEVNTRKWLKRWKSYLRLCSSLGSRTTLYSSWCCFFRPLSGSIMAFSPRRPMQTTTLLEDGTWTHFPLLCHWLRGTLIMFAICYYCSGHIRRWKIRNKILVFNYCNKIELIIGSHRHIWTS